VREKDSGFTLIEMLIVVAIIGILAAVAMPFFQGYIVRARMTEVENTMTILKSAATVYYQNSDFAWPDCPSINEVRNSLGVGLSSVTRISQVSIANSGVITMWLQDIDSVVDGKTLTLTPSPAGDGSLGWRWGWSADFPVHLRPKTN